MTADLLPCPFCGGDADISHDHTVEENHGYGCRVCDIWFDGANSDDPVAAWNRRAPASAEMGNPISTSAVKVKPLEWRGGIASSSIGDYVIAEEDWDDDPFWFVILNGKPANRLGEHRSEASAKAAAQADYEARILSALQTGDA